MEMSAHGHHLPNEWESDILVIRKSDQTILFSFMQNESESVTIIIGS